MPGKKTKEGWVYILHQPTSGMTKIGRTNNNPRKRIDSHLSNSPCPLMVVYAGKYDNYTEIELLLHKKFKRFKFRQEWFKVNIPDVLNYIFDNYKEKASDEFGLMDIIEYRAKYEWDCEMMNGLMDGKIYSKNKNDLFNFFSINTYNIGKRIACLLHNGQNSIILRKTMAN